MTKKRPDYRDQDFADALETVFMELIGRKFDA